MLIVLVLVTWMPWCICKWAPNACGMAHTGTAVADADDCCSHSCCSGASDGDESDSEQGSSNPCGNCPSACCAPKLHVAQAMPPVPCDLVGLLLPPSLLVECLDEAALATPIAAVATESPPGRPPDGRSILLQSSILRT